MRGPDKDQFIFFIFSFFLSSATSVSMKVMMDIPSVRAVPIPEQGLAVPSNFPSDQMRCIADIGRLLSVGLSSEHCTNKTRSPLILCLCVAINSGRKLDFR